MACHLLERDAARGPSRSAGTVEAGATPQDEPRPRFSESVLSPSTLEAKRCFPQLFASLDPADFRDLQQLFVEVERAFRFRDRRVVEVEAHTYLDHVRHQVRLRAQRHPSGEIRRGLEFARQDSEDSYTELPLPETDRWEPSEDRVRSYIDRGFVRFERWVHEWAGPGAPSFRFAKENERIVEIRIELGDTELRCDQKGRSQPMCFCRS